jgi:hypothetical protein
MRRVPDPNGAGFWRNLTEQLTAANPAGFEFQRDRQPDRRAASAGAPATAPSLPSFSAPGMTTMLDRGRKAVELIAGSSAGANAQS